MSSRKNTDQMSFNDASECCWACGQRTVGRWENISKGLCAALIEFHRTGRARGRDELHPKDDCGFDISALTNFQKLRYHKLVEQARTSGYWRITPTGERFLQGLEIPKKLYVFNNRVLKASAELVTIHEILGSHDKFWLEKADYVAEMSAVEGGNYGR